MKQLQLRLALGASCLALLLAACGGKGGEPSVHDSYLAGGPGPLPTAGTGASSQNASMRLQNRYTNVSVTGLFVSPTRHNSWGPDLLDRNLGPGQFVQVTGIPCADAYDLRVALSLGTPLVMEGVDFPCGRETALTVP